MAKTNYDERIEKLAEDYVDSNYDSFTKGKDYAALEKRYSDQGRRAMDDTVGQVAARTGGLASSYAASAGQQAYGEYMGRLEDAARGLYDSQQSERLSKLGVARDMQEYQRSEAERALSDFSNDVYMDMYLAGDEDLAKMTYGDLTKRRTAIPEGFDERDFEMLRRQVQGGRAATVGDGTDYNVTYDNSHYANLNPTMDYEEAYSLLENGEYYPGAVAAWENMYRTSYFENEIKKYGDRLDEQSASKIFEGWVAYDKQKAYDYLYRHLENDTIRKIAEGYGIKETADDENDKK